MKKFFATIILITLISFNADAQFVRGFGLKVGGTIANQAWDYTTDINFDPDNKLGFNIGLFAEFLDVPFLSVVGELNYVQKGVEEEVNVATVQNPDGAGETTTWTISNNYLNLSLLGKIRMNLVVVSPYIIAGPKMDFEVNRDYDFGNAPFGDEFKKSRFGMKVGAGTEINLVVVNLLAEFIYDFDFNPLYEGEFLEIKTSSFDFRIGIYF